MRRTFAFDVLACPRCGGRLRLIALIEGAAVIGRILGHLDLPTHLPVARPARAPPLLVAAGRSTDRRIGPLSDGSWLSMCRKWVRSGVRASSTA